jgi:hypothetical protein
MLYPSSWENASLKSIDDEVVAAGGAMQHSGLPRMRRRNLRSRRAAIWSKRCASAGLDNPYIAPMVAQKGVLRSSLR